MKKLLPIILCLPIMTLAQQTYVPDDNFEAWIERTYPAADNGSVNDDYILTAGIEFLNQNISWVNINNNMGPIFDLTGVEDFKCHYLKIDNTFITSLDLSNLDLESNEKRNTLLFYIYNDGTVEKKIIIE